MTTSEKTFSPASPSPAPAQMHLWVSRARWPNFDAAIAEANATAYGLSASIWTRDITRAHKLARRLQAGNVRVNAATALDFAMPFGGMKQSGVGREGGLDAMRFFTEPKTVCVRY